MALTENERNEIRTMLHEVIDPWQQIVDRNDRETNISLNNIDNHLDKLNSKVAQHEKIINVHLPHTIQHCPQSEIIKELEQDMVTWKRLRGVLITSVGAFAGILTIIWMVYKLFIEKS